MKNNRLQITDYRLQIGIFCLFSALLIGCTKREIKNIGSSGKNIICFGDSVTLGYGAKPGQDYPSVLSKMTGMPVINAGIDGDTSSEALKRLKSDVLDREPLLVIIELGGNDFLRRMPFKETIKNIEEMIEKIQSAGAMVAVTDIGVSIIMSDYGKEFKRLSEIHNAIFLPHLFSSILTNPSLKNDAFHPNAEGYQVITEKIYRAIIPYLKKNASLRQSLHYGAGEGT